MKQHANALIEQLATADLDFAINNWRLLGSGQNSTAILLNEEWVVRFPSHSEAAASLRTETEILRLLQGRLSAPIPNPEITIDIPGTARPVYGYKILAGASPEPAVVASLGGNDLKHLGLDLGVFMGKLHAIPLGDLGKINLPERESPQRWNLLKNDVEHYLTPHVDSASWQRLETTLNTTLDKIHRFTYEPTLRHGDFGFGNFLLDQDMRLSGVIDFGSVGVGDPAIDVAGLISVTGPGKSFIDHIRPAYPAIDDLAERAHTYRETFAIQHALLGARSNDDDAIAEGLDTYLQD